MIVQYEPDMSTSVQIKQIWFCMLKGDANGITFFLNHDHITLFSRTNVWIAVTQK